LENGFLKGSTHHKSIFIFNNNGGRDVVDSVEKGDIEVNSWCAVGIRGVTGSGV
jgi:hypothetical protein